MQKQSEYILYMITLIQFFIYITLQPLMHVVVYCVPLLKLWRLHNDTTPALNFPKSCGSID